MCNWLERGKGGGYGYLRGLLVFLLIDRVIVTAEMY